jgi:hypothetical protein
MIGVVGWENSVSTTCFQLVCPQLLNIHLSIKINGLISIQAHANPLQLVAQCAT